ncbi:hypothetical protein LT709_10260 [Pseudomonas syringae pv. syringae]|uniref:hypothetical protein n=1 Tax=Pseudomonas syringae group TaxID=136849 RepID=UPI0011C3B6E7|nr:MULTISPECIES: hypothetical protein [Pseudomonas syringae group]MCK9701871.1 hypothetical protein [Pseudomonas syringae pv. syringae]MCK9757367.1 hypothetical protein [Pseudomonas syringae pv. syringae]MCK9773618.1 hypothetical protein [Pseudomonas syringae pv. syringae]
MSALLRPLKQLVSRTPHGNKAVPIFVVPMTAELVDRWHYEVQKKIRKYKHWYVGADERIVRADKDWNWQDNFTLLALHNLTCAYDSNNHDEAIAMCIVYRPVDGGEEYPIGMLTALPKFYSNVSGSTRHRAFTWYLSDAPREVYSDKLGIPTIQGVAKALVDCSIQAALDEREDGDLLLKSDAKGGEKLIKFYTLCGMNRLPGKHPPITPVFRRFKTSQYFHFLGYEAQAYSANPEFIR